MMENVLDITSREAFRNWLEKNSKTEHECWLHVRRGRPDDSTSFWYIDAVEEALCFGWIDSVSKGSDGTVLQRFSPRQKGSPWTERNKERVRRLEKLGLMTDAGRAVLPTMGPNSFRFDPEIVAALKQARVWSKFRRFHPLYQRVRAYNIAFYKKHLPDLYEKGLARLIDETRHDRMYGEWNDYGRLLDY